MPPFTQLRGVTDVDQKTMIEILQENLVEFFNWGLLEAGGYTDITFKDDNDSILKPVHMSGISDGRIWQSSNRNWVWEYDLESERQPIPVSGVYVDGTFYEVSTTGNLQHFINYPEGRVVFNNPLPTTSEVRAEYSYRWVNFYDEDVPWFRDVIFDAYRFETGIDEAPAASSGVLGLLQEYAVQLPAVIVETVPTRTFRPRQLGDLSQWLSQDFLLHILTEYPQDRRALIDIITLEKDTVFYLFDSNARNVANDYALDWHGSLIPGAKTYPMLVNPLPDGYRYKKCMFTRMLGQESSVRLPLYRAIIRVTMEVDTS